jgi:hypothetical protein
VVRVPALHLLGHEFKPISTKKKNIAGSSKRRIDIMSLSCVVAK